MLHVNVVIIQRLLQSLFRGKYPHVVFVTENVIWLKTVYILGELM